MKTKYLLIVLLLLGLSSYPVWEFFKRESALYEKRQSIRNAVLLDSLYVEQRSAEFKRFIESSLEWRNYGLDTEAELRWKISTIENESKLYNNLCRLILQQADSERAELKKLKQNSQFFLFSRKISTIGNEQANAFESVKAKVLATLNTPSSAKFASFFDDQTIVGKSGTRFSVSSYVDAQNDYGATIRKNFFGIVERGKDKKWHLLSFALF